MTTITPKPTLIIGLVGLDGSGKDTVAAMLQSIWHQAGYVTARTPFADPIRAMCREFLTYAGVQEPDRYLLDRNLKEVIIPEIGVSYRHLAQTLGTEWGQHCIGRAVWMRVLSQRMQSDCAHRKVTHFVVPDVRFAIESDWLRDQGAVLWRIERPGVQPVRKHVSEHGIDRIRTHRTILNDRTLDDLRRTIGFELHRMRFNREVA